MSQTADGIKTRFTRDKPCPVCQAGTKNCCATDGGLIFCRGHEARVGEVVNGYACVKNEPGSEFRTFRKHEDAIRRNRHTANGKSPHKPAASLIDWQERHRKARELMTEERLGQLAVTLGIPAAAVEKLQPGYEYVSFDKNPDNRVPAFVFPMVDSAGQICGMAARNVATGEKKTLHGGHLGIFAPEGWRDTEGPIFAPEGASDVAALTAMGLASLGRPSNKAGTQHLADLTAGIGRDVTVLGEMDVKDNGKFPGLEGAAATAKKLASARRAPVCWSFTPGMSKDVRVWCAEQGLTAQSPIEEWQRVGEQFLAGLKRNEVKPPKDGEEDPELIQAPDDIPTLADARAAGAAKRWVWEGWIQADLVNGLVANFGDGKTRFIAELIRRIRAGQPWPDGQPMTLPKDSTFLFVPLDYQHSELIDLAEKYSFPEDAVYLNTSKDNADGVSPFDTPQGIAALERRVAVLKPEFVVIDPITAATSGLNLGRAEDATAIFSPLQRIARKYGTCFLILIHTNAQGGTYGRHGTGKFRTEIKLAKIEQADGSERYRIEVSKSNSKRPGPIGATQRDDCWEFDDNPPETDQEPGKKSRPGPKPKAQTEAVKFLREKLDRGERLQVELVKEWENDGRSRKNIFAAAKQMIDEGEMVAGEQMSPRGRTTLKTWMVKTKPPPDANEDFPESSSQFPVPAKSANSAELGTGNCCQ